MQIHGRVGSTSTRDTGAKVDVISGMEEVGLSVEHEHIYSEESMRGDGYISQDPNALPFPLHVLAFP